MNTFRLYLHFNPTNLSNPPLKTPLIIPIKAKSKSPHVNSETHRETSYKNLVLKSNTLPTPESPVIVSSKQHARTVVIGAVSVGVAFFLMGLDGHKAVALGPEGPLMEEFWDNMRRYGLYVLTVSTGAIYTLLQPIVELLKNPISAILILVIFGGGIFIVSQVVTAMVGLSDFSYDYSY